MSEVAGFAAGNCQHSRADKGKPAERRGRKATGLPANASSSMTAGLPDSNAVVRPRFRASPKPVRCPCPPERGTREEFGMRTQLLAMLLTATLLPALAVGADAVVPGQPAPDFALKNAAGENLRLSEWRGEVVLLSFWAGWCGRCSDQLQQLEQIQKEYAGRGLKSSQQIIFFWWWMEKSFLTQLLIMPV